jgi:molybdopterin-containing oxidoreductase family iron-sulfur binding subunit
MTPEERAMDERRAGERLIPTIGRLPAQGAWRSLAECRGMAPALEPAEFAPGASEPDRGLSRRGFLKLLAASVALAGIGTGCEEPEEQIHPYVVSPPEATPGVPLHFATTMTIDGYGTGLLVESHGGRPTKIEGNPDHPASLGAAGVFEQAAILGLYDPRRAKAARRRGGGPASWPAFVEAFGPGSRAAAEKGKGLRFLLEPVGSPLEGELIARIRAAFPEARVTFHSPLAETNAWDGARAALGRPLRTQLAFRAARVVLALDTDFLAAGPFALRYARHFADGRRVVAPGDAMNRLYAVEGRVSLTGSAADHRLRCASDEVEAVARAVLAEVLRAGPAGGAPPELAAAVKPWLDHPAHGRWARAVARDLAAQAGGAIVLAGDRQPAAVHAIAHALNALLGSVGKTVSYTEPVILEAGEPSHDLALLCDELGSGAVDTLVVVEGNPSYAAPADLALPKKIRALERTVYLGLSENETARDCAWFVPAAHFLESWGDARAADGTISLVQPLIAPLYGGKTAGEFLAAFVGDGDKSAYALLRESWQRRGGHDDFEGFWQESASRGVVPGSAAAPVVAAPRWAAIAALLARAPKEKAASLEIDFLPDAKVRDGRFAENPWLLELPDPVTKLTWENAALISPALARRLGVEDGDRLALALEGRSLVLPALVVPGQAEDVVGVALGWGREAPEGPARGAGADAFRLRTRAALDFRRGLSVVKAGGRSALAVTQGHFTMAGRPIVLETTLAGFRANPDFAEEERGRPASLYAPHAYTGTQWAMAIDLTLCTGCSACVVACQSENNTPVVGKAEVARGREMHWLRLDRYYTGGAEEPASIVSQPMMCQHCEKAPCEYACPVNATAHSEDGLNEMTYNRCVGTRFCSNNCPYKVRRFNWFNYNQEKPEVERMAMNPDVTVRERGVMEKCTYCVQRIREAEIRALRARTASDPLLLPQELQRLAGRPIAEGELQTACQQACPTRAVVFGSLGDPASAVARLRESKRSYGELADLGAEPRTRYLARLWNRNPEIPA